jgi:Chalcone isomerase-like
MRRIALFLLSLAVMSGAGAATLAGVDVPDSAQVAGTNLVLNGVGLRTKVFFKIYVGALYLPQKSDDPATIIASTGPDRVLMHMIYEVSKDQFADAWHDDFKANNPDSYDSLHDQIEQFIAWFGDSKKDDVITIDWVPGQGTQISWNGTLRGTIAGDAFHKALMNVFFGANPPTKSLKNGMLGKD